MHFFPLICSSMNPNEEAIDPGQKIDHVRNMIFQENSIQHSKLLLNRTTYPTKIPNETDNIEDLTRKGKMRIREHGFETIDVPGNSKESLFKAVNRELTNSEADHFKMYKIGIMKGTKALAEALSVRIIVFNARGKDEFAIEFPPHVGTKIVCSAYVLCVAPIWSLSQAYALEPIRSVFRDDAPSQPSNTREEEMRQEKI
ncbi:hypothetical protein Tco_0320097 [Tanacetum coccineum]